MAFEGLTDKLQNAFKKLSSKGKLTEADVKAAMREVRMALLEADVNFTSSSRISSRRSPSAPWAQEILGSLTPGQQVIKIVNEELTAADGRHQRQADLFAPAADHLHALRPAGRGQDHHGRQAGLTCIKKGGKKPLLVACDVYRPAAIKQLQVVGEQVGVEVFENGPGRPGADRQGGRGVRPVLRPRPGHHRHRRPSAHRREADGGAARRRAPRSSPRRSSWWWTP